MASPPHSSSQSYYVKDMKLGSGVDVVSGRLADSAIDTSYNTHQDVVTGYTESFSYTTDISGVHSAIGLTNSVTLPSGGVKKWNFTRLAGPVVTSDSISTSFLILDWELKGTTKHISDPRLSDAAKTRWALDKEMFARTHGHCFVSAFLYKAKFIAVWWVILHLSMNISSQNF